MYSIDMNKINVLVIITAVATILVFAFSQQVYAYTTIQSFNITEHEANKANINDDNDGYCYTSTCLLQNANELMNIAREQAYLNDIYLQYLLNDLDSAASELEQID